MNCIELMVEEHKNIKRMLKVIRKYCYKLLKGENIDYNDFYKIIDFIRNYADKHHHGKEERMLFNRMAEKLGPAAEHIIKHGMLVEHEQGRLYIHDLEVAVKKMIEGVEEAKLDVIANAISYTHLLNRHIDKEDNVVYKFAQSRLSKDVFERINKDCREFEQSEEKSGTQDKYLKLLAELEQKV